MNVIVFGSTGGTGLSLISQALEQGHHVTAFARQPNKIEQQHASLTVVQGDVLDASSVGEAIKGQDAVLCSLGKPNIFDASGLRAKGTANIIDAMRSAGVRRLVCQSALGTGESANLFPFHYRYLIAPLLMRRLYQDHSLQERHIRESNLDWTIVRPAILTDGERTGAYQHGFNAANKPAAMKVSRADTAHFMLAQLTDASYLHQSPCIAG